LQDSFVDPSDEDAVQEANRRMAEARQRLAKGQAPEQPPVSAINDVHTGKVPHPRRRIPPHAQAAEVDQQFEDRQIRAMREAQNIGSIGGVPVYKPGGSQVLQDRPQQVNNPFVDPTPKSSVNPNFRPAKK
jgi:hypothetical protein